LQLFNLQKPPLIFSGKEVTSMPHMHIHKASGGIVFTPTKEECEIIEMKRALKQELENVRKLKEELLQVKKFIGDGK